ncbi:MAG: hypothetical protein IPM76_21560 [Chloroflexi bacterium]|nr:hypothetical protein [Chloroflexota bacterium]
MGIGLVWRQALSAIGKAFSCFTSRNIKSFSNCRRLYFFIPIYGVLGAAWVSLTAYALAAIYLGLKLKQSLNVSWSLISVDN